MARKQRSMTLLDALDASWTLPKTALARSSSVNLSFI